MAFIAGDTATAAQAITFAIDFTKNAIPAYTTVCVNSLSEDLGYQTETWSDFCSGGSTSTATTGFDITWSGEATVRFEEPTYDWARYDVRYDLSKLNNLPMKITNTLLDETVTTTVSITSFNITYVSNEIIKFSFEMKPFAGKPVGADIV